MEHKLPPLPYERSALEPHMSTETLDYHYGKHHLAYVNKLNELIPGTEFADAKLEDIIKKASGPIYNNAAQFWNHIFFWDSLAPNGTGGGAPTGKLAEAINAKWGSHDKFKDEFKKQAVANFGAGWTWLVKKGSGLEIVNMGPAGTPLTTGDKPLFGVDVWEHAYYIDYRNDRAKYVDSVISHLANWAFVAKQFG